MNEKEHDLLFEVRDDKSLLLWVNDSIIIPFRNKNEWINFAEKMLGMIPEIDENLQQ